MELGNILILLVIAVIGFQFWKIRSIAEYAVPFSKQYCRRNGIQFVSLARQNTGLKTKNGKLNWQIEYELTFSSNGENAYQGIIVFHGKSPIKIELPPYAIATH